MQLAQEYNSLQAEQSVLGGLLIDNSYFSCVNKILKPIDFSNPVHNLIYSEFQRKNSAGSKFDVLVISQTLLEQGKLTDIGGEAYLFELAKNTPSTSNILAYADMVKTQSQKRQLLTAVNEVINELPSLSVDDALHSLKHKLKPIERALPQVKQLNVISIEELLAKEIPPRELLLSPWLPRQGLAMCYAPRGIGKTFFALNVGFCVASAGDFLCWKADKACNVLLIDGEMPMVSLQERLASIIVSSEYERQAKFEIITPDMQLAGMIDLATEEGQQRLEPYLTDSDLIIVDNISTLCRSGRENEAESWLIVQEWALRMRSLGKSVLFIHHAAKNGNQRGTSRKEDILDSIIALKHPKDYDPSQGARFEVHFEKSRGFYGEQAQSLLVNLKQYEGKQVWEYTTLAQSTYQQVIDLMLEKYSQKEIADELGLNKSTVSRHVNRAKKEGLLS